MKQPRGWRTPYTGSTQLYYQSDRQDKEEDRAKKISPPSPPHRLPQVSLHLPVRVGATTHQEPGASNLSGENVVTSVPRLVRPKVNVKASISP